MAQVSGKPCFNTLADAAPLTALSGQTVWKCFIPNCAANVSVCVMFLLYDKRQNFAITFLIFYELFYTYLISKSKT